MTHINSCDEVKKLLWKRSKDFLHYYDGKAEDTYAIIVAFTGINSKAINHTDIEVSNIVVNNIHCQYQLKASNGKELIILFQDYRWFDWFSEKAMVLEKVRNRDIKLSSLLGVERSIQY